MNWSRQNSRGTKLKQQKHHKHPSSLEHDSHSTSCWQLVMTKFNGIATCCKFKKNSWYKQRHQADLPSKPKLPLFLTFWVFFQSRSVHDDALWLIMNNYGIKFERLGVQSASGTISAPALFVVFAELFASRRKNQATSSKIEQHRATIGQFCCNGVSELWRFLLDPPCFVYHIIPLQSLQSL